MENNAELDFAIRMYEMAKSDLYTLLVEGSKNKLDFIGEIELIGSVISIDYRGIVNPAGLNYASALHLCVTTVDKMLKNDIRLWKKTEIMDEFFGFSPNINRPNDYELSLALTKPTKSE